MLPWVILAIPHVVFGCLKIYNLNLKQFKTHFKAQLLGKYPDQEIESFFYRLTNAYLNLSRVDVSLNYDKTLSKSKIENFTNAIKALNKFKPLQYILGDTDFYGLNFKVTIDTLIPRPETEELVDWVINDFKNNTTLTILDIGTGSGCIAISLAKHLPKAKVYAIDVSDEALKIANQNAKANKTDIEFLKYDILKQNQNDFNIIMFDAIVSNPPYVRVLEKKEMQPNVLNYEPHTALFVDDDNPLIFYKSIAQFAKTHLKHNGALYFEINQYLGLETKNMLHHNHFKNIELRQDVFGNDRMIKTFLT